MLLLHRRDVFLVTIAMIQFWGFFAFPLQKKTIRKKLYVVLLAFRNFLISKK